MYLVAQLGARRHYAIPRMLHEANLLDRFCTDILATKGWPRALHFLPARFRSAGLKRLLGRVPHGVPEEKIRAFTSFGWEYRSRRAAAGTPTEQTLTHLWAGKRFCELVLAEGLGEAEAVYTFNSAGLELLAAAKSRGLRAVTEQTIAPREIEVQLLREEENRHSGWENASPADGATDEFIARERAEWALADLILCGSDFVKDGIAKCGGPADKCRVVPYGVSAGFSAIRRNGRSGPLRVLTVGRVGLRKGTPYVLEVARQLRGVAEFRMVGGLSILPGPSERLGEAVKLLGEVPRSEVGQHFAWADVFFLPSLCEGSATVVYEALSAGLPVICTPNTGSVVRHGLDGYIVPARDVQAMTAALARLARNPVLLNEMSVSARQRASEFTLEKYGQRLVAVLNDEVLANS